jgi:hypothetical protein
MAKKKTDLSESQIKDSPLFIKFYPSDIVWLLKDNKVCTAFVSEFRIEYEQFYEIEKKPHKVFRTEEIDGRIIDRSFYYSVKYKLYHEEEWRYEHTLFPSKEELLKSL